MTDSARQSRNKSNNRRSYRSYVSDSFIIKATSEKYSAGQRFDECGAFESVRFGPTDDGFIIGTFAIEGGESIVCKGTVPGFVIGAPFQIKGKVVEDKKWGIQVNIEHAIGSKPSTVGQMEAFLGSGAITGIGPSIAKKIVKHFGKDTLKVLEEEPDRLEEVSGIGSKTIEKIKEDIPKHLKYRDIIGYFASLGISIRVIDRLIEEYGTTAKDIIERNPYILCRVRGFAFTRADSIAMKMGISKTDRNRLYAGVLQTVRYLCDTEGHTLVEPEMLVEKAQEKLQVNDITKISQAMEELVRDKRLIKDADGYHLKYLFNAEKNIKKRLMASIEEDVLLREAVVDKYLTRAEERKGIKLTQEQSGAVRNIFKKKISILSGKAGTGKAQPLASKVLTDRGWKRMGWLEIGDMVRVPRDGSLAKIVGIYPQGVKDTWEITLENGKRAKCCDEHIWHVLIPNEEDDSRAWIEKDITLREIIDSNLIARGIRIPIANFIDRLSDDKGRLLGSFDVGKVFSKYNFIEDSSKIISIERAGRDKMQCIMVDHPDHLYITDDYIVTHNTAVSSTIVEICKAAGIPVCLMSPTGRAAKHLSDTCGGEEPGFTMHRALAIQFKKNRDDDFFEEKELGRAISPSARAAIAHFDEAKIVIADEASMMDTEMASILFRACKDKHLMLVGDPNQLPSVGPGRVLGDLMESSYSEKHGMLTFLTKVFRQKEGSPVINAANAISEGKSPCKIQGVRFYDVKSNDEVQEKIERHVLPYLAERKLGYENYAFLSPIKKTPFAGVNALNDYLRPKLNPYYVKPNDPNKEFLFQRGDFVMQTKNNYDIDIFNGDIGVVQEVTRDGEIEVLFSGDEDEVCYEKDEVYEEKQIIPAFAMTVHKSQGDQYDTVVVVLTSSQFPMLNRNLLYTAVTRAENELILIGDAKAFAMAAKNQKENNRKTGLRGI